MRQGLVSDNTQYFYKEQDPNYRGEPFDSSLANGPT